jgi:hypothetical protein
MKRPHEKQELVALLMESPMYFDLRLQERLRLFKDLFRRWPSRTPELGLAGLAPPLAELAGQAAIPVRGRGARGYPQARWRRFTSPSSRR